MLTLMKNSPDEGIQAAMELYMGLVYTVVSNKVGKACSSEEIEDCTSDAFCELYKKRNTFDTAKGSIKAFLCVVAKNKAVDLLRKKAIFSDTVYIEDDDIDIKAELTVEDEYINSETKRRLMTAINDLGEPDREIILRKFFFSETSKQIGERLDLTEGTVNTRTHRALKKLKQIIRKEDLI